MIYFLAWAAEQRRMGGLLIQRRFNDWFEQRHFGAIWEYITNIRRKAVGLPLPFGARSNPIPWINAWLVSDNVQVAPHKSGSEFLPCGSN